MMVEPDEMFASEEDFLRHFQAEAALLRSESAVSLDAKPVPEPAAELLPVVEPVPLRTEEDFLRLFQAEMQGMNAPPTVSPFTLVEELNSTLQTIPSVPTPESDDAAEAPVSTVAQEEFAEPPVEAGLPMALGLEQVLAADMPLPVEEVMSRNAAWLLGLEPLPVIELDEPTLRQASAMPAAIPDSIEIPILKRVDAFGAEVHGGQRPSSQGAMAQLLEREPGLVLKSESTAVDTDESLPVLRPVMESPTAKVPEPAEPVIMVPAWLQAQMQRDLPNSFPADVIPKQEPSAPVIVPRRVVPKAPVTVPIEGEAKNWLGWWK